MAKFSSIFRLKGTLENMTFVQTQNGEIQVRRKTSVDKSRINSDPAFVRTRENAAEFTHNAQMGKLLRRAVVDVITFARDRQVSTRLVGVLSRIKNLDMVSPRGERKLWIGLETEEGRRLLKGFDFNRNSPFTSVVLKNPVLDVDTSTVTLSGFRPDRHLFIPQGATHASFSLGVCLIQFEDETFDTQFSAPVNFAINSTVQDFALVPDVVPEGEGRILYLFLVEFFQEINGTQYQLKNGAHNSLHILEVL